MKKIYLGLILLFFTLAPSYSMVQETFMGVDTNSLKAGISKHILTRGGKVIHNNSYEANNFQGMETLRTEDGIYNFYYSFNLVPIQDGTRLDLIVYKGMNGDKPQPADLKTEQKTMERIKSSIKGRYLYGLGFEFDYYDTPNGKIKAPKGRDKGIKLTAVKYDAQKKGLMAGDIITEINGVSLDEIPIEKYAVILNANSMSDSITLTYKRRGQTGQVTLIPRLSNARVF